VRFMLNRVAYVSNTDSQLGRTALHLSLGSGRVSLPVLERLIPAGADSDQEDDTASPYKTS
jgi:ankyrin repeat protein